MVTPHNQSTIDTQTLKPPTGVYLHPMLGAATTVSKPYEIKYPESPSKVNSKPYGAEVPEHNRYRTGGSLLLGEMTLNRLIRSELHFQS